MRRLPISGASSTRNLDSGESFGQWDLVMAPPFFWRILPRDVRTE